MLSNIKKLFVADLTRLKKYNILQISVALAVIYAVIIYFANADEASSLVTLLVYVDATMMSIILLGASLFFEKQEGSLKSTMVSPVTLKEIIVSKILSAVTLSFITAILLSAVAVITHGVSINIALLLVYAVLGASAHIVIGFALVIISKNFNALLVNYVIYVLVFTTPALLFSLGVIPTSFEFVLYLSPSFSTLMLLQSTAGAIMTLTYKIVSIAYLIAIIVVLYKVFIQKKFREYIMKG